MEPRDSHGHVGGIAVAWGQIPDLRAPIYGVFGSFFRPGGTFSWKSADYDGESACLEPRMGIKPAAPPPRVTRKGFFVYLVPDKSKLCGAKITAYRDPKNGGVRSAIQNEKSPL